MYYTIKSKSRVAAQCSGSRADRKTPSAFALGGRTGGVSADRAVYE